MSIELLIAWVTQSIQGSPDDSAGKESACSGEDAGDSGLIPGQGRSPGGVHGKSLQYSCLENPKDRGAWWAKVHGVAKISQETWQRKLDDQSRLRLR